MVVSFSYRFDFLCQFRITVQSEAALLGGLRLPWQPLNNAYFFLKPRRRIECKCLICLDCRRWSQALVPAHIDSIRHANTHSWLDGWFAAKHNETIPRPGAGEHHQSVAFGCRWLIPLSSAGGEMSPHLLLIDVCFPLQGEEMAPGKRTSTAQLLHPQQSSSSSFIWF